MRQSVVAIDARSAKMLDADRRVGQSTLERGQFSCWVVGGLFAELRGDSWSWPVRSCREDAPPV